MTNRPPSKSNIHNLIAACAAICVFGFAFGMTYPLLSLLLEAKGYPTEMIGINAAMMPIGILLFSGVIPLASRKFGSRNLAIMAAFITAILILSFKVFDSLAAWFLIRLFEGMSVSVLFVLSESWVVRYASDAHRGRIVAIYASVLSASFGAGPAILAWIGIEGWLPFALCATVIIAGIVPLSLIKETQENQTQETGLSGCLSFTSKAPILLLAVLVFAVFDGASLSLIPVYGLQLGLDLPTASNILTALIIGNVIFQYPIGWLADRHSKRLILGICALLTALFAFLLPSAMNSFWMWPTLIFLGIFGYGVYTVSLASLGDRFTGHELITGASSFAIVWGIGASSGSILGGWSMAGFGPHGLPILIGAVYVALLFGLIGRFYLAHYDNSN